MCLLEELSGDFVVCLSLFVDLEREADLACDRDRLRAVLLLRAVLSAPSSLGRVLDLELLERDLDRVRPETLRVDRLPSFFELEPSISSSNSFTPIRFLRLSFFFFFLRVRSRKKKPMYDSPFRLRLRARARKMEMLSVTAMKQTSRMENCPIAPSESQATAESFGTCPEC